MKPFLKPSRVIFYLLSTLLSFGIGLTIAIIFDVAKGQMLAGGAIVLGYGVVGALLGLIVSVVVAQFFSERRLLLINSVLIIAIVLIALAMTFSRRSDSLDNTDPEVPKTPTPTLQSMLPFGGSKNQTADRDAGLGVVKPNYFENPVLHIYQAPNLQKSIIEHLPSDSLVFARTELGLDITYAPPWFAPLHMKLDYEVLYLRASGLSSDFIEVVVNEYTGQSAFISRYAVKLLLWPSFLLTVDSVNQTEPSENPVRIKPLAHASTVAGEYAFLRPLLVENEYLKVEMLNGSHESQGMGWIRWRQGDKLLITYSLFS